MDGLTALRQIKMNPVISYLKVVMFSACADRIRASALELGALDCLQTPFDVKTLLSAVERGLRS
jgi:CheY-like chemotaxis protein